MVARAHVRAVRAGRAPRARPAGRRAAIRAAVHATRPRTRRDRYDGLETLCAGAEEVVAHMRSLIEDLHELGVGVGVVLRIGSWIVKRAVAGLLDGPAAHDAQRPGRRCEVSSCGLRQAPQERLHLGRMPAPAVQRVNALEQGAPRPGAPSSRTRARSQYWRRLPAASRAGGRSAPCSSRPRSAPRQHRAGTVRRWSSSSTGPRKAGSCRDSLSGRWHRSPEHRSRRPRRTP
jgi:hypothetical protein